ncbi:MAG: DUF3710 domain-containing protein [Bifidobacteriaceae bacterium]|jgi:hypothetical protein|nr:DUF3710 domain-containing protein [Bifidobacteriaceae bacterium]MCI1978778.1 DUF3710 domain-containing protein [Bifidobacteriaceae bacterium]
MGLFGFGKKKHHKGEESGEGSVAHDTVESDKDDVSDDSAETKGFDNFLDDPERGPWDVTEAPTEGKFLDLGGFRLPAKEGISLRLSVSPDKTRVLGVTVTYKESSLELSAIAAPKSHGLWDEICAELLAGGKEAKQTDGTFGKEIELTVTVAAGRTVPTRIVGVDGNRWMLRGIFTGKAAREGDQKEALDDFFASIVVNRGEDPLAPRDPLPLHPPVSLDAENDDAEDSAAGNDAEVPGKPKGPLTPLQNTEVQQTLSRGPMFSEVR